MGELIGAIMIGKKMQFRTQKNLKKMDIKSIGIYKSRRIQNEKRN